MPDEEKVVKVDFTEKRPRPGAKPKHNLVQSKTVGTIVLVMLVALVLFTQFVLPSPTAISP